jgi:hypothetical protein
MAPAKMVEDLKRRMENLCTVRCLPRVNPEFLEQAFSLSQLTGVEESDETSSKPSKMRQILDKRSTVIQSNQVLNTMLYHNNQAEVNPESYQGSLLLLAMCGWDCPRDDSKSKRFKRNCVLQCSMCGSRAGLWNFDKETERPCELDYISWKQNNTNNTNADSASSPASKLFGHSQGLQTRSLRGSAKATGYTCLTSPLYVASPVMVNLFRTIAGGDTLVSSGLELDFGDDDKNKPQQPSTSPPEVDSTSSGGHQRKKQKREQLLNTRDPALCRSETMHPLNGHKKYCPWRYSMQAVGEIASVSSKNRMNGGGARPGWLQCMDALAQNECDHPQQEEAGRGGQFPGQDDLVSMLNKVQKVVS